MLGWGCHKRRFPRCWGWILAAGLLLASGAARAENPAGGSEKPDEAQKIHVVSDRLVTDTGNRTAEFIGNVRATQAATVITSDRLRVEYDTGGGESADGGTVEIRTILASGNVRIHMDDKVAVCDQAVYTAKTGVLVLTGSKATVTSEGNSVSGEKIVLHRTENRMVVEGGSRERVEAVLYSKDKGIE